GQESFLDEAEIIESLVERFGGNGGVDQKLAAADPDSLARDAVLQKLEIGSGKGQLSTLQRRQPRISRRKLRRTVNPLAVRGGHFKNSATGPQTGDRGQFLLRGGKSLRKVAFENLADGFEIAAGSVVDGGFNAADKSIIANPEKAGKGSGQDQKIERGEADANGESQSHAAATVPREYPKPRCVWMSLHSTPSSTFLRRSRTKASSVFSLTSRPGPQTLARISWRETMRPAWRARSSR